MLLYFLFHIILPGIKAELKYATPLPLFKVNDTCIVCLLFYSVLTVENLRGSSVLHPWSLNMPKQVPCCTMQPWLYCLRNEDWTVFLYHQMRPEKWSTTEHLSETASCHDLEKNSFSFTKRYFKHGQAKRFIQMSLWFKLLPIEIL